METGMSIQMEFWQFCTLCITLLSIMVGIAKMFFNLVDQRAVERHKALEDAREASAKALAETISRHVDDERTTNTRVGQLADDVDKLSQTVAGLKAHVEASPTHNDLSAVYKSINAISEKVDSMSGSVAAIEHTLRQILSKIIDRGMQ
jgi:phage shock protein A